MTRIVSLLPAATEIVAALGGMNHLVGISHECDFPPSVASLPRVTSTPIDPESSSADIDREVRQLREEGQAVIGVEARILEQLKPDVILTQSLCEVCAVSDGAVHRLAQVMSPAPRVLSLAADDLAGIFDDIRLVASTLDLDAEAEELIAGLRYRLGRLPQTAPSPAPRVLAIEWLEPMYLAGHWVPELIGAAGGLDLGARPGDRSRRIEPDSLAELKPDLMVVMLCGFTAARSARELARYPLPDLGVPVWLIDGNAFTSRAGPRVVDGAALLQAAMKQETRPGLDRVS